MKQAIQILGMTCQGCRKGVEEKLATMAGVSKVSVSLEQASAEFETKEILDVASISAVLGEKYTVDNLNENSSTPPADSKWKQLRPLFLIFGYVIAGSFLLSRGQDIAVFMQYFMGLFYIVFSFFKLLDYRGFPASFQQYDPIAKRLPVYGWVYPFIETVLGLAFLLSWQVELALWITVFILGSTTLGVVQQLRKKSSIQCACLGTVLNLPMTEATLVENTIMLGMAFAMLVG